MSRSLSRPRGNVTTRLVLGIDSSTDAGRAEAFHRGSQECLGGAETLHSGYPDTGEYILTFHALELALKAYLAKAGLADAALRKRPLGHNLVKLYAEACARGLSISVPDADALIEWINEYHDRGAPVRYEFTQTRELPNCETLFPIIRAVLASCK